MRFALVGCGDIARRYARTFADEPRVELVGATDVLPGRADEFAAEFGGRSFPSLEALLDDPEVEAVVNLTVPQAHAPVTRAALDAGKHVHSEKPLALRHGEAAELVALAERRGLCLSCSPATLLGEAQQTAWKLVREDAIGRIRVVYAEANWGRIETWHAAPAAIYGVGPVVDVGVYSLSLVTAMLGPARRVRALGATVEPERVTLAGERFRLERPDFVTALVELEGDVLVRLTATFWVEHQAKQRGLELHGDRGSIFLATWASFDSRVEVAGVGKEYVRVPLVRPPYEGVDWSRTLVELEDAVREGRPHRASGAQAAHVVEILDAVHESVETGRAVAVESTFDPPPPMEWAL